MANRTTFSGSSTKVPWKNTTDYPEGFGDQYARHIRTLYNASCLPLTGAAASGNDVTATVDPDLSSGLVNGMSFLLLWPMTNTGPVTLSLNGGSAVTVTDADGSALASGAIVAGSRSLIAYLGGAFRVIGGRSSGGAAQKRYYRVFTASGTWTKPSGLDPNTMVTIELWGGGGGSRNVSGNNRGGGGGAYARRMMRLGDIPSSVAVAIGSGGGPDANGGNTSFGSLLTARGGKAPTSSGGGSGGEPFDVVFSGGAAATDSSAATPSAHENGGGGGGYGSVSGYPDGAPAIYGGGGGGANYSGGNGNGGTSVYGGNGGDGNSAGSAPGGGGGGNASGARGEARIWL